MACSLLLGTMNNRLSFQWQSSPDLLAWSYLSNNKTNILRHEPKVGHRKVLNKYSWMNGQWDGQLNKSRLLHVTARPQNYDQDECRISSDTWPCPSTKLTRPNYTEVLEQHSMPGRGLAPNLLTLYNIENGNAPSIIRSIHYSLREMNVPPKYSTFCIRPHPDVWWGLGSLLQEPAASSTWIHRAVPALPRWADSRSKPLSQATKALRNVAAILRDKNHQMAQSNVTNAAVSTFKK